MDTGFIIVVAVALCLMSAMIVLRMAAGGVATARIAVLIAELWLTVIIWIVVFQAIGEATGAPAESGGIAELRGLASRLAGISGAARLWLFLGVPASVALAAHLMWSLGRTEYVDIRP
ncbi:MAG: hypothetical protein MUQ65_07920 [Armatimonadetes bacterium]|nr:hypothetical protein [Armatimonadota bacterium]